MMIDFSSGGADITLRIVTETVWLRKSKKQRGIGTGAALMRCSVCYLRFSSVACK